MDNNWLATQQIVQANKEFAAASSLAEQMSVIFKWSGISARQDFISGKGMLIGLKDGLADSGLTSLDSAAQLVAHPIESFAAMKDFVESASTTAIGAASDALALQLAKINTALQEGGDENAEQARRWGKRYRLLSARWREVRRTLRKQRQSCRGWVSTFRAVPSRLLRRATRRVRWRRSWLSLRVLGVIWMCQMLLKCLEIV
nr:hypothetical protein [Pseudomonas amygdali]